MALPRQLKGLSVGTILWIKELDDSDDSGSHGLPSICFKHPCVVVDLVASAKGFAQIYVITSKGGRNINDLPLPSKVRRRYVPIRPQAFNDLLPGVQLRLESGVRLRKDSYVNIEKVYTFPLSKLELYSHKRPVTDFCLDSASIRWLRQKAFGDSHSDAPITLSITPAPTIELPNSYYSIPSASTSEFPSHYYPVRPIPQYAAAPSASPSPIALTAGSFTSFPQPVRHRNRTVVGVMVVASLILLASAMLLVYGIAVWASGKYHASATQPAQNFNHGSVASGKCMLKLLGICI